MATIFKLNNIEVNVQTDASFYETLDETLDSGSVTLAYNTSKNPIAPMTPFSITNTESGETLNFFVIVDEVEIVKKSNPMLYSHKLTFTQNTHKLSKIMIRNSVFAKSLKDAVTTSYNFLGGVKIWKDELTDVVSCYPVGQSTYELIPNTTSTSQKIATNSYFQFGDNVVVGNIKIKIDDRLVSFKKVQAQATDMIDFTLPTYFEDKVSQYQLTITKYELTNGSMVQQSTYTSSLLNRTVAEVSYDPYTIFTDLPTTFFEVRTPNTFYRFEVKAYIDAISSSYLPTANNFLVNLRESHPPFAIVDAVRVNITIEEKKMSLYKVLDELRSLAQKVYKNFPTHEASAIYNLPNSGDVYNTLSTIEAPNFTFTQCDLYSCVAQVFNYIDAVPTLDSNNVLGFEYYNDNSGTRVNANTLKFSDKSSNLRDEYYANKIGTTFQQARKDKTLVYPADNLFRKSTTRNYGIASRDDYIMPVSEPIDYIDKVEIDVSSSEITLSTYFYNDGGQTEFHIDPELIHYNYPNTDMINKSSLDITRAIYEEREQAILPETIYTTMFPNANACLKYTHGDNYIDLMGETEISGGQQTEIFKGVLQWCFSFETCQIMTTFDNQQYVNYGFPNKYTTPNIPFYNTGISSKEGIKYRITYHPLFDGKAVVENEKQKYDGEFASSQSNANVQLSRLGTNMQGLIAKLGNEERTATIEIKSFNDRIRKGTIYEEDGQKFVANTVRTTFGTTSDKIINEVTFVKNYNELSRYTSVDNAKRFYEIDSTLTQTGYETIVEYLYFSTTNHANGSQTAITQTFADTVVKGTLFGTTTYIPTLCEITCYNKFNQIVNLGLASGLGTNTTQNILTSINAFGFGNMLCYQVGFNDPINAGDITLTKNNKIITQPTYYCSQDGYAHEYSIAFYDKANETFDYYPLGTVSSNQSVKLLDLARFRYLKKPNEIFKLNYEIACLPYPNEEIFFGDHFIYNNATLDKRSIVTLRLYTSNDPTKDYSILDKKATGTIINQSEIEAGIGNEIIITLPNATAIKNWCIADTNGNIYISGNFATTQTLSTFRLYYSYSRWRV